MFYQKAADQGPYLLEASRSWGRFIRYLEFGDDLHAVRHVDQFENGQLLSYDRSHWIDDYGMLADMKYSPRWKTSEWAATDITPEEFEKIWCAAARSPIRQGQIASARMSRLGPVPIWLTEMKRKRD
jgi:hypothetical protein